jgi:hypothetical protein
LSPDAPGEIQNCLEKWISICPDKHLCVDINTYREASIYRHADCHALNTLYLGVSIWNFIETIAYDSSFNTKGE